MGLCNNCHKAAGPNAGPITNCDACNGILHLNCIGITESEVRKTRSRSKSMKIVCDKCDENITEFKDEFSASMNKLKDDPQAQLDAVKQSVQQDYTFEDIVNEIHERQKRVSNLVIFGLTEQLSTISAKSELNYMMPRLR